MKLIVLTISMVLSFSVFAEKSTGCGVGWMVTNSNTTTAAGSRASTNGTFLSPIAMTLGTSGCDRHSIVLDEKMKIHYIENNYDFLLQDIAEGAQGEYFEGLTRLYGCNAAEVDALRSNARSKMDQLIIGQNAESFLNVMNEMANSCNNPLSV